MDENRQGDEGPTDPRLDAMLDEALSPTPAPSGLTDRIIAATAHRLPAPYGGVIARIGVQRVRWAAAVAVLVGWTGIWAALGLIAKDAHAIATVNHDLHRVAVLVDHYDDRLEVVEAEFDALAMPADPDDTFAHFDATNQSLDQTLREWETELGNDGDAHF